MSQASQPVARTGRVGFELDRFELIGDRCELEGRWSGVRGRRFMRPALMLVAEGKPTRLLADLADKPWAAEDGQPWRAAFPFALDGRDLPEVELTVAPDVTITLPAPARSVPARPKLRPARTERSRADRRGMRAQPETRTGERRKATPKRPGGGEAGDQAASLARQLADAEDRERRLTRQLEHSEAEQTQKGARLDDLLGELSQTVRDRDQAHTARDRLAADLETVERERDQVRAERDAARRERDEVAAERDAARQHRTEAIQAADQARATLETALADRGSAITGLARAESERDAATAARDQAISERDGARALRDHALAERDAAVAARDEANYQRDALSRTSERLQSELAGLISTRGAAMVMRRAAEEPLASRRHLPPLPVVLGVIAVLVVVLLIVLRVA